MAGDPPVWHPDATLRLGVVLTGAHRHGAAATAYADLLRIAAAAETAGLDSVWLGDHVGYREQPWLGNLAVLAGVAQVTERIGLGAIMIGALRPHAVLADDLATVDAACAGRLSVCVVAGWRRQEFQAAGVPYRQRTARAIETVRVVRGIWAGEPAQGSHAGPGLTPVHEVEWWFGGSGQRAAGAAAELGAGFLQSTHLDLQQVERLAGEYTSACAAAEVTPRCGVIRQTHVAATETAAHQAAEPVLAEYYRTYQQGGLGEAEGLGESDGDLPSEAGRFVVGAPETVAAGLARAAQAAAAGLVLCRVGWPGLPTGEVIRAVELLGTAVLPALREVVAA